MNTQVMSNGNGNARLWWRVPVAAALLAWATWLTINTANYVSGKDRGERLSTTEAALMIEKSNSNLRLEWAAAFTTIELRIYDKLRSLEEQLKILNDRLRLDELKAK